MTIFVTVPVNITWYHTPLEMNKVVVQNETGYYGSVDIINTGNSEITLEIIKNGTIAPYINLSESSIVLPFNGQKTVYISYSSPSLPYDVNYTGYLLSNITGSLSANTTEKTRSSYLAMFVAAYDVRIISPKSSIQSWA